MIPIIETFYSIPGAPRIALLADMHGRPSESVLSSLSLHQPELICVPGDVIYGLWPDDDHSPLETEEHVMPLLKACAKLAPTFLSLGNHERYLDSVDLSLIRSVCVNILDNTWIRWNSFVIGGLTSGAVMQYREYCLADSRCYQSPTFQQSLHSVRYPRFDHQNSRKQTPAPTTAWLSSFSAVPGYHILLSHHPEYYPLIPESVELILSGHAHGGQWRFFNPLICRWDGVFAPDQGLWPKWTKGVYDRRMVVSADLANTAPVPRLFNPTEIVYIDGTAL